MAKSNGNDFNPKDFSDQIEGFDKFKKEYEGVNFYHKVKDALCESKLVEDKVKAIVWEVIKSKLLWIILTAVGLIITDMFLRAVPSLMKFIT